MPAIRFAGDLGMWTNENRARYDRSKLRYLSDVGLDRAADPTRQAGWDQAHGVNGLMYILTTGCQWVALPGASLARKGHLPSDGPRSGRAMRCGVRVRS